MPDALFFAAVAIVCLVAIAFAKTKWHVLIGAIVCAGSICSLAVVVMLSGFLKMDASGGGNKCENVSAWISEAPRALEEFRLVKQEILSDRGFLNRFSHQGMLFVKPSDSIDRFFVPRLMEWFARGRGYISFRERDTVFEFRSCEHGWHTASGTIYSLPLSTHRYKSMVVIVDSLRLNDRWIAHVTTCTGCNE